MRITALLRSALAVAVAGAVLLPTVPATAAPVPPATAAAAWLNSQLVDGAMPGPGLGPDWGMTIDTQWALTAAEADPIVIAKVVAAISAHVKDFINPSWGPPDGRVAGSTAKTLLAAVTAGQDPRSFGGYNVRQETLFLIAGPEAGVEDGRLRDYGTGSDTTNVFSQSLAVMGLARSGGVPESAVRFLLRQQCGAGYFRMMYDDRKTCDEAAAAPDGDGTAMAVQALMAAKKSGIEGLDDEIAKSLDWFQTVQQPDGSFGGGVSTENANSNSTGLVAQALATGGRTAAYEKAKAWMTTVQLTAANATGTPAAPHIGAIAYNPTTLKDGLKDGMDLGMDQWRRATAQAIFAFAPVAFGDLDWTDPNPPVPTPTPTTTITTTATATTTSTVTTTMHPTAPTVTTTRPGPTATHTKVVNPPPLPRKTVTATRVVVSVPTAPALPRPTVTVSVPGPASVTTISPTTPPQTAVPGRTAYGTLAYLESKLVGRNHLEVVRDGTTYVDYDGTVNLGLALRQTDKLPGTINAISSLMVQPATIAAYTQGVPYDQADARYVAPLAKLVLLLALGTKDEAGSNLATELTARLQPDGRLTDQSTQGDQSNLTSQAYSVLALLAAGKNDEAKRAMDALLRQQCGDGSFPARFGPAEQRCQTGDIASTAMAVQALNAVRAGSTEALAPTRSLRAALKALTDRQDADGNWKGGWQQNGQPDVPVTAAAVVALRSAGLDTTAASERLTLTIGADGGLPVNPADAQATSDVAASTGALLAMTSGSLLTADPTVLSRAATAPFTDDSAITPQAAVTGYSVPWAWLAVAALVLVGLGAIVGWLLTRRQGAAR
ncbi:hypothetical protein OG474_43410 [Kribbella sp. NBC_01505]|uniref:prenyltransferase/squalene oxidase repeat-containing protein n=1 Tax=Kribbella sp. NBC_01505 TaxID=2903580 RepID=UPI0038632F81